LEGVPIIRATVTAHFLVMIGRASYIFWRETDYFHAQYSKTDRCLHALYIYLRHFISQHYYIPQPDCLIFKDALHAQSAVKCRV
jgi:hypothetical protein